MDVTPIGPRTRVRPRRLAIPKRRRFWRRCGKLSGPLRTSGLGRALEGLQAVRPGDSQGSSLQKTAQSIGGCALRLATSPHADPGQVSGLSNQLLDLAEAGHNLPRIGQIGEEIRNNLAAMRAVGGLEAGAEPALRRAEDDTAHLQVVAGITMAHAPAKPTNMLTAEVGRTIGRLNAPPWRDGGARDEVSSMLLGIAGTTYSMAATAGGSWAPAPVRRSLMALTKELRGVVDGDVRTTEASGRLSRRLEGVVEATINRTGDLLGMDQNIRSIAGGPGGFAGCCGAAAGGGCGRGVRTDEQEGA